MPLCLALADLSCFSRAPPLSLKLGALEKQRRLKGTGACAAVGDGIGFWLFQECRFRWRSHERTSIKAHIHSSIKARIHSCSADCDMSPIRALGPGSFGSR